jgi:hypothetical protein
MKKIDFGAKRPSTPPPAGDIDQWVAHQSAVEPMKRLTIDVGISLHRRIKSQCALDNLVMADVIRELLERRFPARVEEGTPHEHAAS